MYIFEFNIHPIAISVIFRLFKDIIEFIMPFHSMSESESDDSQPITDSSLKSVSSYYTAHTLSEICSSCSKDFIDDQCKQHYAPFNEIQLPAENSSPKSIIKKAIQKKKDISMGIELKELKEKLKLIKPKNCLKNVTVSIEESLLGTTIFEEVTKTLNANEIKCNVVKVDHPSVTWLWQEMSTEFCKKYHIALIWHLEHFLFLARKHILIDYFIEFMKNKPNHRVYLVLYGNKGFASARNEVDYYLCELEVILGISHNKFDKSCYLANFLLHMTKSVSQEPYRAEIEKIEREKTFYLQGRSHNCVKIDKQYNGMKKLWIQQVAAIHKLPLDTAKVVCRKYSTPYALYEAYNKLTTIHEKQNLLREIVGGRDGNAKKLGPRLSGRIALMFANKNGDLCLSDWKL